jgi:predicted DNA-binding protein YlxM (UPF0122 family)
MKNTAKQMIVFTQDMIIASVVTIVFFLGAIYQFTPFSTFLDFGTDIKESWEKQYGTAPYSHAELSSLKSFCKKVGFDLEKSEEILKKNKISYELEKSLSQIAKENSVSPQFIYNLLKTNFQKSGETIIELTGLGKKQIKDVAQTLRITPKEFLAQLKTLGIEATENDKFKEVAESYDMSPMDIMTKLGYKKPN